MSDRVDIAVIGGGFYGCCVALEAAAAGHRVAVLEKEDRLMRRASLNNQARVHHGYHYPRSLMTALGARRNFDSFVAEFGTCIGDECTMLYAIARFGSHVSARQFSAFCRRIGAPLQAASSAEQGLFNSALIDAVFRVREYVFDARMLATRMAEALDAAGVSVRCGITVNTATKADDGFTLSLDEGSRATTPVRARLVFDCTYSALNKVLLKSGFSTVPLRHERAEIALIEVPPPLSDIGVTVMDGPFFSSLPFPPGDCHSLTHVRYTPACWWADPPAASAPWRDSPPASQSPHMIRDASRFLPLLGEARYRRSLWETKTILPDCEIDDSRPIVLREAPEAAGFYSVLGGKIDNILDIRVRLRTLFTQ